MSDTVTVRLRVGGRMTPVQMRADDAAEIRRAQAIWRKTKRERQAQAFSAIEAANIARGQARAAAVKTAIDAARMYELAQNSDERLIAVLDLCLDAPPDIFWPVFLSAWSRCDATWPARNLLVDVLRKQSRKMPARKFYSPAARQFFDGLPDRVKIWRGCSRARVRGVAWTVDYPTAARFANGHRGIAVPDPVIAEAMIAKRDALAVFVDRNECELVIDPARLSGVAVTVL